MVNRAKLFGFVAFLMAISFSAAFAEDVCKVPVPTNEGPVIGARAAEPTVCAYKGIPYAAPPVGDLRWKAPQPAAKRDKPLEVIRFGARCPQVGIAGGFKSPDEPEASEGCLFLNVWRPAKEGKFPVMFWIHGGGLVGGAGSEPMYVEDHMTVKKDVVVITINYRLSVFGFLGLKELAAEDPNGSSGNYGLLDQIAALKWVRDDIANFGGDPGNVTIFGESAGGWSVCNLLASPLAAGTFHKAIIQSGGCDTTQTVEEGYAAAKQLVTATGCAGNDILKCLRAQPTMKTLELAGGITESFTKGGIKFVWLPKEDGYALKETPINAIRNGRYNKVPLMVGSNRDEIKLMLLMRPGIRSLPNRVFKNYFKKLFGNDAVQAILKLYPAKDYSRKNDAFLDAMGDIGLGCKCWDACEAAAPQEPVYYYRFDYDAHRLPHLMGAAHAMEIPFVFGTLDSKVPKLVYSRRQAKAAQPLSDAMMSYWTNFGKTGNPNGPGLLEWPKYDTTARQRMYFDLPMRVGPTEHLERCEYWDKQNIKLK